MKEYIERAQLLKNLGYDETRRADVLPGSTFDIVLKRARRRRCGGEAREMGVFRAK